MSILIVIELSEAVCTFAYATYSTVHLVSKLLSYPVMSVCGINILETSSSGGNTFNQKSMQVSAQ